MKPSGNKNEKQKEKLYTEVRSYQVRRVNYVRARNGGVVFFDLEINGVTIYGCKVATGRGGDFISFPSRLGSDGKYYNIAYIPFSPEDQEVILETIQRMLDE